MQQIDEIVRSTKSMLRWQHIRGNISAHISSGKLSTGALTCRGRSIIATDESDYRSVMADAMSRYCLECMKMLKTFMRQRSKKEAMKILTKMFAIALMLFVASCSYQDMADKLIPKEESQFARNYLQKIRSKDFDYVRKYVDKSIESEVTDQKLTEISDYFPSGSLISTEIIGSQVGESNSQWHGNFTFEYQFSDGWALANVVLKKSNETLSVVGFNVYRETASQKEINKFSFNGKSATQFMVLAMAVASAIFVLVTVYFCIRTPIPRRKWLWVLFMFVGVGSVSVNWTTGQYGVQPLYVMLFSSGATSAGPFAPWIISTSLPIGAIIFWFKRKAIILGSKAAGTVFSDG